MNIPLNTYYRKVRKLCTQSIVQTTFIVVFIIDTVQKKKSRTFHKSTKYSPTGN